MDLPVLGRERRVVAFHDLSHGDVISRKWDFGDGSTSVERDPVHTYREGGPKTVTLSVSGARRRSAPR